MAKIHVNPVTGESGTCHAKVQCRFGGEGVVAEHFDNEKDAQKFSEKVLAEKHGVVSTQSKNAKFSTQSLANKYKESIGQPVNSSDLAFTVTSMDKDFLEHKYAMTTDLLSADERLDYLRDPENPKLRQLLQERIEKNVSKGEYENKIAEEAMSNYVFKAALSGSKIAPEWDREMKKQWESKNDSSIFSKKATEEILKEKEETINHYENLANKGESLSVMEKEDLANAYYSKMISQRALDTDGRCNPVLAAYAASQVNKAIAEDARRPQLEDYDVAAQRALQFYKDQEGYKWNALMGDAEKTDENIAQYETLVRDKAGKDRKNPYKRKFNEHIDKETNARFFERRYNKGFVSAQTFPMDKEFEKEWNNGGKREAEMKLIQAQESRRKFKEDVEDTGGLEFGQNKKIQRVLDQRVKHAEAELKSRGRNNPDTLDYFKEIGVVGKYTPLPTDPEN